MKSEMISLAAPSLCGSKSSWPMLPEMSTAMAMSTPSPRMTSRASADWGLATAIITSASATKRSPETKGMTRRRRELPIPDTSPVSAYLMPTGAMRRFHT